MWNGNIGNNKLENKYTVVVVAYFTASRIYLNELRIAIENYIRGNMPLGNFSNLGLQIKNRSLTIVPHVR
jgi:hypothetical protein